MKRLHRDDVPLNLTSRDVVIRGLPERGLSFKLPDCQNMLADNKLNFHCLQNYVPRQQGYQLQKVQR